MILFILDINEFDLYILFPVNLASVTGEYSVSGVTVPIKPSSDSTKLSAVFSADFCDVVKLGTTLAFWNI